MSARAPGPSGVTPVLAVVGVTASGKSALALDLAEALGGEVVNTDAMQLYRGMDVGTAKLPPEERRGIRHHLLDRLEIDQSATVAHFQGWAREAVTALRGRGVTPVLAGGSALYVRAVLDHFEFPGTDEGARARWEAELEAVGPVALHRVLAERDPEAAARMEPVNGRRTVRALEVIELTGRPYSASLPRLEYVDPATVQVGVRIDRPTLDARIAARVHDMFAAGFVAEVERLRARGLARGRTASRAIGYPEVAAYLAGESTLEQAQERTVFATRRFARRQDSWWRKDPRIVWVDHDDPDRVEIALAAVSAVRGRIER